MQKTFMIEKVGRSGDGVATDADGKKWYVPTTLPNEKVSAEFIAHRDQGIAGRAVKIENPSPYRQTEPCPHVKSCGGCSLQHMTEKFYQNWQLEMVKKTLALHGVDVPVKHIFQAEQNSRRRATFHIEHVESVGVKVGFYDTYSDKITVPEKCLVLQQELLALQQELTEIFAEILAPRKKAEVFATVCENGLDILMKFPKVKPKVRIALEGLKEKTDWQRLAIQVGEGEAETLWQKETPFVYFGETAMPISVGGFLQATKGGELAIVQEVLTGVGDAQNILEFFAGGGTITLPLLETGKNVEAVELGGESLRLLKEGAKAFESQLRIAAKDLFKEKYAATDLNEFNAIVLDPPRSGARTQVATIAKSDVPKVVMVSCNVKTFAQDAATLQAGGYALKEVFVIDQFLYTPHVEVVGLFTK